MLLAFGGSLVATQPASAIGGPMISGGTIPYPLKAAADVGDVLTLDLTQATWSGGTPTSVDVTWVYCSVAYSGGSCPGTQTTLASHTGITSLVDTYTLQSGDFGKFLSVYYVPYSGSTAGTSTTYPTTSALVLGPTQTSAPTLPTAAITPGSSVSLSDTGASAGVWSSRSNLVTNWMVCTSSHSTPILSSAGGTLPSDCKKLLTGMTTGSAVTASTVNLSTAVNKLVSSSIVNFTPVNVITSVDAQDAYLAVYEYYPSSKYFMLSATKPIGTPTLYTVTFNANGGTVTSGSLTATQASSGGWISVPALSKAGCTQGAWSNGSPANAVAYTPTSDITLTASWTCAASSGETPAEAAKPLPVWAAPILKQVPSFSKTLTTEGGKLSLKDGDYSSLKSVTVAGKEVAYSLDAKGDVTIPVPAGKGGTTADLVVTFTGGKMVIQDGIKYVEPTDVAKVVERPVAIAAGAKKITETVADQIRQAAYANMNNTTIQCVAYAASNSAAARAAAQLTAVQACGIAVKANPALKVSDVAVIVNKAKAKTTAVGIKVYK